MDDGASSEPRTGPSLTDGCTRYHRSPPDYQTTRFTLDDTDLCLGLLRILSVSPKHGTAILQPHIRSLTVTRQTKQPTNERNPQ